MVNFALNKIGCQSVGGFQLDLESQEKEHEFKSRDGNYEHDLYRKSELNLEAYTKLHLGFI